MPELPEVETIRAQLAERIPGRSFARVEVHDPKLVSPEDPAAFAQAGHRPAGSRSVGRRGKYLLIELDSGRHARRAPAHDRAPALAAPGPAEARSASCARASISTTAAPSPSATCAASAGPGSSRPRPPSARATGGARRHRAAVARASPARVLEGLLDGRRGPIKAVLLNQALVAGPRQHVRRRGPLPGAHPPRAPGRLARRRRDPPPAPGDPRPAGARPSRRAAPRSTATATRWGRRARCRTCCACTCTPASPARAAAPRSQDPRRPARDLLVPALPAGAGPVVSDVAGVRVGHWTDAAAGTGCTVVIPPPGTVGAVEVRGGGPATRETELLAPLASVGEVTALLLTGGSAFGLDAAAGVMRWCEERGLGPRHRASRGCRSCRPRASTTSASPATPRRPGPDDGYAACEAAARGPHAVGSVGAGTGATVGKLRGRRAGARAASARAARRLHDGIAVAALAVVNAWGDVLDERGEVIAGAVGEDGLRSRRPSGSSTRRRCTRACRRPSTPPSPAWSPTPASPAPRRRWWPGWPTRGWRGRCRRCTRPIDGDAAFCLATGARPASVFACGVAAAEAVSDAIRDAVRSATSVRGVPTGAERAAAVSG